MTSICDYDQVRGNLDQFCWDANMDRDFDVSPSLFENIVGSALLLDKAGRICDWNEKATHFFGYQKKEVLGKAADFLYEKDFRFPQIMRDIISTQKPWIEKTTYIQKNGTKKNCYSYLCLLNHPENKKPKGLLIQFQSNALSQAPEKPTLSQRDPFLMALQHWMYTLIQLSTQLSDQQLLLQQSQRQLRDSERRFFLLAENSRDIISRHSPEGHYIYVSPVCADLLGYTSEQLIGKNILKFIHPDDINKTKKNLLRKSMFPTKPITYRMRHQNGEYRWFESTRRLMADEKTLRLQEIQLTSRDITEHVIEKKVRLRGQQLAHSFRLNTMEEMASGLAHEISQPLGATVNYIRGCLLRLESCDVPSPVIETMQKAASQAERAGEILQRLKNFFCKGQLVKSTCHLNELLRETINLMRLNLTSAKTKLDSNCEKSLPTICLDRIQIQQVLVNLIQNSIESMSDQPDKEKRITIDIQMQKPNAIMFTVKDTGVGFNKENLNKVFMPFFTTKAYGRGMGLAICRSIVEAHGGEFQIQPNSHHNNGWIRFSLPIHQT